MHLRARSSIGWQACARTFLEHYQSPVRQQTLATVRFGSSGAAEQPLREQRLRVTTPVSNEINDDPAIHDPVDQAIGFEERLAELLDSQLA